MTTLREAAQQAPDALDEVDNCTYINEYGDAALDTSYESEMVDKAIAALRTALAEQPAPVTDAEIDECAFKSVPVAAYMGMSNYAKMTKPQADSSMRNFARRILAAAIPPRYVVVPAAEVEALRRDAERYRWLRGQQVEADPLAAVVWKQYHGQDGEVQWLNTASPESLDRGIDTALAARPGGEG